MLDQKRDSFKGWSFKTGEFFSKFPLSPDQITLLAFLFVFIAFYFLVKQEFLLTIIFFLIAGFLDFVDGAVARFRGCSTHEGAYLDTVIDRYIEGILLFGMLFLPLPAVLFPAHVWIFLTLFGSIVTTYAKAAAKEKELVGQELKGGLASRGERILLLLLSLILAMFNFRWMVCLLIFMAFLTNFTALQRVLMALKNNSGK
jgi:phosphatidylglycerophosphate synthase